MSDLPSGRPAAEPWVTRGDLRFAAFVVAGLAVTGALAGLVWGAWSRTATRGLVYTKTAIIPDQTEGFISSDGRFAVITAVIGLVAAVIVWRWRGARGPFTAAALAGGCALGAFITDLVGRRSEAEPHRGRSAPCCVACRSRCTPPGWCSSRRCWPSACTSSSPRSSIPTISAARASRPAHRRL